MAPLFSIITVTYNAADTITATLESVAGQTCKLYEHIIMDGASTDSTMQIVKELGNDKVRSASEKDNGIYDAMNKAMSIANGEYLIFLNSGDRFHSQDTLQIIADSIMKNDYPGILYGQTDLVDRNGKFVGKRHLSAPENLTLESFKDGMVVCHQAFIVYNRLAKRYNIKYKYSADFEWCIICLQHSKQNIYLNTTLIDYLNEGLTTRNHRKSLMERFKIMSTYYGLFPTLKQHVKFLFRYIKRRKDAPNIQ